MSGPMGRPGGGAAAGPGGPGMGPGRGRGPGGGPPGMHMGMSMPVAKAHNFRASFRRLLNELRPESPRIALVLLPAVISVTLAIIGPKILGNATDVLYTGFMGKTIGAQFPRPSADPRPAGRGGERHRPDVRSPHSSRPCQRGGRRGRGLRQAGAESSAPWP